MCNIHEIWKPTFGRAGGQWYEEKGTLSKNINEQLILKIEC